MEFLETTKQEFLEAVRQGWHNFFKLSGRANRAEYWYWGAFVLAVGLFMSGVDAILLPNFKEAFEADAGPFETLWHWVVLIPTFTLLVRRLHDIDLSGEWILFFVLFYAIILTIAFYMKSHPVVAEMAAAAPVFCLLVIWPCFPGTEGANRFDIEDEGQAQHIQHEVSEGEAFSSLPEKDFSDVTPLTFIQAIAACFSKYSLLSGRAARREYWYWMLFLVIVIATVCAAVQLFHLGGTAIYLLFMLSMLSFLVPTIAVLTRRYHDTDVSGWNLVAILIFGTFLLNVVFGVLVVIALGGTFSGSVMIAILGVLLFCVLVVWPSFPGTYGPNRYGPDPL